MDGRNVVVEISKESCLDIAKDFFMKNSGMLYFNRQQDRIKKIAKEVEQHISDVVEPKGVYSHFDHICHAGKEIRIEDVTFSCNAFEQLSFVKIKGAFVYMITVGSVEPEDGPMAMVDGILADMWGTAFIDAARRRFKENLEKEYILSEDFGPGFYGMSVRQMKEVAKLVDTTAIGVKTGEGGVLIPAKSCGGLFLSLEKKGPVIHPACEDCKGAVGGCNFCNLNK